ncbi:MAG TPA: NEW3 domain-containing protein [Gemmatimonadaceae bacterium]|nr:NEW3 domain-containing protein [Gemmatimonadaceae bacterium]
MSGYRAVAVAGVLAFVSASYAAAQTRAEARKDRVSTVALASWSRIPGDSAKEAEITLPSVLVSGAPRSFQVVSIPIPEGLGHSTDVEIEIAPHGDFSILGAKTRRIDASTSAGRFAITIGIPAGALAGHLIAAEARFTSPGSPVMIVPVEIEVNLVRQVALRHATAAINAQAGSDVILPFDITNAGNALERIETLLTLPSGWAMREVRLEAVAVAPGETIRKRVRVRIPQLSATGTSFVRVELRSGGEILRAENLMVDVFNPSSIGSEAGPLIVTSVSRSADENGRPSTMYELTANGALYDSVRIAAHFAEGSTIGGAASNAFAHLGTFQSSASVQFSAPSGQLNLGNTGASFSDLTGLYSYGQGALLQTNNKSWSLTAMGAMSMPSAIGGDRKPLVGLRADHAFGRARLYTSLSHLSDEGFLPRRLDALGVGAAVPALFGSTFKAEIAERRFPGGSGFGWSSELERAGIESNQLLRVTHAPGGSDAFARAENEVVANFSQRLKSRASLSGSAWRTTDATAVFSGLNSNGIAIRPQYALFPSLTLALEARSYVFDATSRPVSGNFGGGFGTREQQLGVSASAYRGRYYVNSSASFGRLTRSVSPAGQPSRSDRTPRNYWMTSAGWSGQAGVLELSTRIEQMRDVGGFVNQQNVMGVRGDQVVLPWLGGIRAEGELQRVDGFGDQTSSLLRVGAAVPIINGFAFKLNVEKNSIFRSVGGRVPWIFGARLEHSLTVPMLRTPGTSGYVYQDLNGNQRRDANEPGVSGAIVRRGNEVGVADGSGHFRVGGELAKPVMVDEASLPDGWSASGAATGDLGVTLSTSAGVEFVVAQRPGFSAVAVDLANAHVIARDTAGHEWGARMTGPTTATFASLPVGTYTLEFDLSELTEPLVARAPIPTLVVTGKDSRSVTVTLDPRPIRMWKGPSSPNNSAPKVPAAGPKSAGDQDTKPANPTAPTR